jgi:hypothetical protein
MNKSTNTWHSTLHNNISTNIGHANILSKHVFKGLAFHITHYRNLQLIKQMCSIPRYTIRISTNVGHNNLYGKQEYKYVAFHITHCRNLQLLEQMRGIPPYTIIHRQI